MYELHDDVVGEVSEQVDEEDSKEEGGEVPGLEYYAQNSCCEVECHH